MPIKPPALKQGDTVAIVAPAAAVDRDLLERGISALVAMGFRVKASEHVLRRSGILAGTDRERAADLQNCFAEPEAKAILAARGGYGSGRLLPLLDFAAIGRNPKIFLGFSDITFLLAALLQYSDLVTFHGPMVAMDFSRGLNPRSSEHLRALLAGELSNFEIEARDAIRPGQAEGEVVGGCLSVVTAMLGTTFFPRLEGRILFLEDRGEKAYQVDRMLVQLKQAGILARVAGIVFGAIQPVEADEQESRRIEEFVAEQTASLSCPVLYGIEAGHGTQNLTIPFGVRARLDSKSRRLTFLESPVE
jgi:muramoyltetrapeptide carboxypeptidase